MLETLQDDFEILGVDVNGEMLKIASQKMPDVNFIKGDMKNLDLDEEFDVIICMFSAMNYNISLDQFKKTIKNFYLHMHEGGVLIFDLGINQENWIEGLVSVDTVVKEDLKLARICQSHLKDGIFNANFVFLVKENGKLDFDIDEHKLGVFKFEEVIKTLIDAGFKNYIYSDFSHKEWDVLSGERPVLVGVK